MTKGALIIIQLFIFFCPALFSQSLQQLNILPDDANKVEHLLSFSREAAKNNKDLADSAARGAYNVSEKINYSVGKSKANVIDICSLVGVKEINNLNDEVTIYPNPVSSELVVRSSETINKIKVFDVIGKKIFNSQLQTKSNNFKLQTSNYTTGVYFIEIMINREIVRKKIVKQ